MIFDNECHVMNDPYTARAPGLGVLNARRWSKKIL
jgi:hypothetical protein